MIHIGINGFGRLGRDFFRAAFDSDKVRIVGIADPAEPDVLTYLLNFDSLHKRFSQRLGFADGHLLCGHYEIPMFQQQEPGKVDWASLGAELVLDATECYRTRAALAGHLEAGAHKVLLCVPPADGEDIPFVIPGVNDATLPESEPILSNASATSHCLVPVVKVLHEAFGIKKGFMTTVRAYTSEQQLRDAPNAQELRLSRAAADNIIPSRTWSYKALKQVMPEIAEDFGGMSMEVPVPNGSNVDLVCVLGKKVDVEQVNEAMLVASQGAYAGIIEYCVDPIVSSDVVDNPHSAIFDALLTRVNGGNLVRTVSWFDNHWGFINRAIDLIVKWGEE